MEREEYERSATVSDNTTNGEKDLYIRAPHKDIKFNACAAQKSTRAKDLKIVMGVP